MSVEQQLLLRDQLLRHYSEDLTTEVCVCVCVVTLYR